MFYSRRINPNTKSVEVWECEWSNTGSGMAKKRFVRKVGDEGSLDIKDAPYNIKDAICWAPGRTIGNIAVSSESMRGFFAQKAGNDALLPCDIVPSGKFRHGKPRWYCKTHQVHWGIKADFAAANLDGDIQCSNHTVRMNYVVDPLEIEFKDFEEIGIWCSLPQALSSKPITPRPPKIHVHKRFCDESSKMIDNDFDAIICSYHEKMDLFVNSEITRIQVTPPAAFEFVESIELGREVSCVACKKCGYPHLDLGDFARTPHRKHFCGNCGNDSVWTREPIVSTPLKPLHDAFSNSNTYVTPKRALNLDEFAGLEFDVWSSTPAVLWTANRPQEKGIHVHVYDGGKYGLPSRNSRLSDGNSLAHPARAPKGLLRCLREALEARRWDSLGRGSRTCIGSLAPVVPGRRGDRRRTLSSSPHGTRPNYTINFSNEPSTISSVLLFGR